MKGRGDQGETRDLLSYVNVDDSTVVCVKFSYCNRCICFSTIKLFSNIYRLKPNTIFSKILKYFQGQTV